MLWNSVFFRDQWAFRPDKLRLPLSPLCCALSNEVGHDIQIIYK